MRGAGCVFNDIVDRKIDRMVRRTAKRPIAAGKISVAQASLFMIFLLLIGFFILIQFNNFAIFVGVTSLLLFFIYPFMKRITYWPQAFLGLTFNWGALLGWASVRGELDLTPFILYCAGFFWTLGYDTIYAHQDKNDDIRIGVKSTAIKFGAGTKKWLSCLFTISSILFVICGYLEKMNWIFFLGIAISATHLFWQIKTLDINCSKNCNTKFKSNRDYGIIIFIGIFLSKMSM